MFPFQVQAKKNENQVILLGAMPMQPMTGEESCKLGQALVEAGNAVLQEQARIHGRPAPALETMPSYEVPQPEGEQDHTPPPVARRSVPQRRPSQQTGIGAHSADRHGAATDFSPSDDAPRR